MTTGRRPRSIDPESVSIVLGFAGSFASAVRARIVDVPRPTKLARPLASMTIAVVSLDSQTNATVSSGRGTPAASTRRARRWTVSPR
jgi:hypothetical protein